MIILLSLEMWWIWWLHRFCPHYLLHAKSCLNRTNHFASVASCNMYILSRYNLCKIFLNILQFYYCKVSDYLSLSSRLCNCNLWTKILKFFSQRWWPTFSLPKHTSLKLINVVNESDMRLELEELIGKHLYMKYWMFEAFQVSWV